MSALRGARWAVPGLGVLTDAEAVDLYLRLGEWLKANDLLPSAGELRAERDEYVGLLAKIDAKTRKADTLSGLKEAIGTILNGGNE